MDEPSGPSTARMIDFWLGGDDHFPVDVAAARAFEQAYGPCAPVFRSLRAFLGRAVRHVADAGVDSFLVFGAGVPTCGNVHEIVPQARVLYTDLDPVIVRHGQRLLAGQNRVGYGFGDARDVAGIDPALRERFLPGWGSRPVGLVFLGLAAFLDDDTLAGVLDDLYEAVAPGSRLAVDFDTEELAGYPQALAMMGPEFRMRAPKEFAALLGRWQPTDDGIVPVARWRPDGSPEQVPDAFYGAVAVKPAG
ncbi:SAM-dependent methyltransferase [Micromonospora sp. WMMD882]|uniref:SAM-dependent methyltransferase n=1 Tax=Micromonospora sp. WMMD882 TaxID=3015151 RepID=UPI00248B8D63|nr:SAM-dependent methyltransferase [Micromonospora sp. WMMD882]WBB80784.1 SAM-dependent methyltransferase [Micromonospora sp. WMMD882]